MNKLFNDLNIILSCTVNQNTRLELTIVLSIEPIGYSDIPTNSNLHMVVIIELKGCTDVSNNHALIMASNFKAKGCTNVPTNPSLVSLLFYFP